MLVSIACPQTLEQGAEDCLSTLGSSETEFQGEGAGSRSRQGLDPRLHSTTLPTWAPGQTLCSLAISGVPQSGLQWPRLGYCHLEAVLAWGIKDQGTQNCL